MSRLDSASRFVSPERQFSSAQVDNTHISDDFGYEKVIAFS